MEMNEKKEIYMKYLVLKSRLRRYYMFFLPSMAILLFSSFFVGEAMYYYFFQPSWMWEDTLFEIFNYMSNYYGVLINIYTSMILFIPGLFCSIYIVFVLVKTKRLSSELNPFVIAEMKGYMKSFNKRGININIDSEITRKDK
jgi:hypothetical protein